VQEAADELEALVVGDVCCRFLRERSAVEVMREICLDYCGRDCCTHRDGVDGHCEVLVRLGVPLRQCTNATK
jgi:hypothetical protein